MCSKNISWKPTHAHTSAHAHTHNSISTARDTYLRILKAVLDYTVSRIKIGNRRTSSQYKTTNITYAKLYKSVIFLKHILQYGSGNTETEEGFGKHGMSRAILCRAGRHMTPLVTVIVFSLLLFISCCGLSTTKQKEETYTTQVE